MSSEESIDEQDAIDEQKAVFQRELFEYMLHKNGGGNGETAKSVNKWIKRMNRYNNKRKKGIETDLTEEQFIVLDGLGIWKLSLDEMWESRYEELKAFEEDNGHCIVPRAKGLGEWTSTQRKQWKKFSANEKSSLTDAKIAKLELIGFDLNPRVTFDTRYRELTEYCNETGHCFVPRTEGPLGRWVSYQRTRYWARARGKASSMTDVQVEMLDNIGFAWSVVDDELNVDASSEAFDNNGLPQIPALNADELEEFDLDDLDQMYGKEGAGSLGVDEFGEFDNEDLFQDALPTNYTSV